MVKKSKKFTTSEIEIKIARHLNTRTHLIVPNVSWGLGFRHELDLLVVDKKGQLKEIEIKISKQDLIKDKEKRHGHNSHKLRYLYFAVPYYLLNFIEHIPKRAGIYVVTEENKVLEYRKGDILSDYRASPLEIEHLGRLAAMRIWNLKETIARKDARILCLEDKKDEK